MDRAKEMEIKKWIKIEDEKEKVGKREMVVGKKKKKKMKNGNKYVQNVYIEREGDRLYRDDASNTVQVCMKPRSIR